MHTHAPRTARSEHTHYRVPRDTSGGFLGLFFLLLHRLNPPQPSHFPHTGLKPSLQRQPKTVTTARLCLPTSTMKISASSCCLVVSSLLLLVSTQATFNHQDKNDKNNEEPLENEARTFREARHSPFFVHNSKELNRALAILEHESQTSHWHQRGGDEGWWADEERNGHKGNKHTDADDATARGQGWNNKHGGKKEKERDFWFGQIFIKEAGDYYLDRDFVFSDGFKLEITGTHEKSHHGHGKHGKDSDDGYHLPEEHTHGKPGQKDVVIHAAPNQRHFTFDDHAILKACDLTFVDGGCDKEGFYGGSMLFVGRASGKFEDVHWYVLRALLPSLPSLFSLLLRSRVTHLPPLPSFLAHPTHQARQHSLGWWRTVR